MEPGQTIKRDIKIKSCTGRLFPIRYAFFHELNCKLYGEQQRTEILYSPYMFSF